MWSLAGRPRSRYNAGIFGPGLKRGSAMVNAGPMYYEDVFRRLHGDGIRYVVVGGVALVLHGVVRLTVDLDLMVDLAPENLTRFVAAMNALGYRPRVPVRAEEFIDPEKRRGWREEKGMQVFSFIHPAQPGRLVDVFVDEPISFEEVDRDKKVVQAADLSIPVVSVEHLKRLKRISSRAQDLADIEALEDLESM